MTYKITTHGNLPNFIRFPIPLEGHLAGSKDLPTGSEALPAGSEAHLSASGAFSAGYKSFPTGSEGLPSKLEKIHGLIEFRSTE